VFRWFKNEIYEHHPNLISAWHAFRGAQAQRRAVEWLLDQGLIHDISALQFRSATFARRSQPADVRTETSQHASACLTPAKDGCERDDETESMQWENLRRNGHRAIRRITSNGLGESAGVRSFVA
jgi:hypothetical protein